MPSTSCRGSEGLTPATSMSHNLTCATCGQPIPDPDSALVEWALTDRGATGFKVVHTVPASPRGRDGCSWWALAGTDKLVEDLPAAQFAEPENLLRILNGGACDTAELVDTLRSLAPNADAAQWVVNKLAALARPGAAALGTALAASDEHLRCAAALALARTGDGAMPAAEALARALSDPNDDVRFRAALAMKVLGVRAWQKKADEVIDALASVMGEIDSLEPFTATSRLKRGIVTRATNLCGEISRDATGTRFLAPEDDYRGGGMGSLRLYGPVSGSGLVRVTSGVFDADIGLWAGGTEPL